MPDKTETWRIELVTPGGTSNEVVQKELRFKPNKDYILRIARSKGVEKGEGMYTIIKVGPDGKEDVESEVDILPEMIKPVDGLGPGASGAGNISYLPPPPQPVPVKLSLEEEYANFVKQGEMEKADRILIAMRMKDDAKLKERNALMGTGDDSRNTPQREKNPNDMSFDELLDAAKRRKFRELLDQNKLDEAIMEASKWKGGGNQQQMMMNPNMPGLPPGIASTGDPMLDASAAYESMSKRWLKMRGVDPDNLPMGMGLHNNPEIAKWQLEDMKEARRESRQAAFMDRIVNVVGSTVEKVTPYLDRLIPKQAGFGDINAYLQSQGPPQQQQMPPPTMGQPYAQPAPSPMLPAAPNRAVVQQTYPVYVGPGAQGMVPTPPQASAPRPVSAVPRVPIQTGVSTGQVEAGAEEVLGILDEAVNAIVENAKEPQKSIPEEMMRTLLQMGAVRSDQIAKLAALRQRGIRNLVSQYAANISMLDAFPNVPPDQQISIMRAVKAYRPAKYAEIVNIKQSMTQHNPGYDPPSLQRMIINEQTKIALPVVGELSAKLKVLTTPHGMNWIERAVEEVARFAGATAVPVPMSVAAPQPQAAAPPQAPPPPPRLNRNMTAAELIAMERAPPSQGIRRVPTVGNPEPAIPPQRVPPGFEQDAIQEAKEAQQPALPPPPATPPPPAPGLMDEAKPEPAPVRNEMKESVYKTALKPFFDQLKALVASNADWLPPDVKSGFDNMIRTAETDDIAQMVYEGESLERMIEFVQVGLRTIGTEIEKLKARAKVVPAQEPLSQAPAQPVPTPSKPVEPAPEAQKKAPDETFIIEPAPAPQASKAPAEPEKTPVAPPEPEVRYCEHIKVKDRKRCRQRVQTEVNGHGYCYPHGKMHQNEDKTSGGQA